MSTSTILYWDPRFTDRSPQRLTLPDAVASAFVRAGVAAAADPVKEGQLSGGGALDPSNPTDIVLEVGLPGLKVMQRITVPQAVAQAAIGAGVAAAVGSDVVVPTLPLLALDRTPTFAAGAAQDTLVAIITNLGGATATIAPNDDRLQVNGSRIEVGGSASSAGTIGLTISALGLLSLTVPVVVTPAITLPAVTALPTLTDNGDGTFTGVAGTFSGATSVDTYVTADTIQVAEALSGAIADYAGKTIRVQSVATNTAGTVSAVSTTTIVAAAAGFNFETVGLTPEDAALESAYPALSKLSGSDTGNSAAIVVHDGTLIAYNTYTGSKNYLVGRQPTGQSPSIEFPITDAGNVFFGASDAGDFIWPVDGGTATGFIVIGGASYSQFNNAGGRAWTNGDRARIVMSARIASFYVKSSGESGWTKMGQIDLSAPLSGTALTGSTIGFAAVNGGNHVFGDVIISDPDTLPLAIGTVTDNATAPTKAGRTITVPFTYTTGTWTSADVRLIDGDFNPLSDWLSATVTANGGVGTAAVEHDFGAIGGTSVGVQLRNGADHTLAAGKTFTATVFAEVLPLDLGVNIGFDYETAMWRDLGTSSRLFTTGLVEYAGLHAVSPADIQPAAVSMDNYGAPHNVAPGDNGFLINLEDFPIGKAGTYTIKTNYTGGTIVAINGGANASNLSSGNGTIDLTASTQFRLTGGELPSGQGLTWSVVHYSDLGSTTTLWSTAKSELQGIIGGQSGRGHVRFMTDIDSATNYLKSKTLTTGDLFIGETFSNSGYSIAQAVKICNELEADLYLNVHHQSDSGHWTELATYVRDHLNTGLKCHLEWSNEVNNLLVPNGIDISRLGYNAGLASDTPGSTHSATAFQAQGGNARYPAISYPAGSEVMLHTDNVDYVGIWRVKSGQTAAIGSSGAVPTTAAGNSVWEYVVGDGGGSATGFVGNLIQGTQRYQAQQSVAMFTAFDTVFGASSRTRLVRRIQRIGNQGPGIFNAGFKPVLAWQNCWRSVDVCGPSSYCGIGDTWYTGGTIVDGQMTGGTAHSVGDYVGASYKALINYSSFKAGFLTEMQGAIDFFTQRKLPSIKHAMEQWLRTQTYADGSHYVPNSIMFGTYEGGPEGTPFFTSDDSKTLDWNYTTLDTYWAQLRDDADYGALWSRFLTGMNTNVGGPNCMFVYAQPKVASRGFSWGMTYAVGSQPNGQPNAVMAGVKGWLDTNYARP